MGPDDTTENICFGLGSKHTLVDNHKPNRHPDHRDTTAHFLYTHLAD